MSQPFTITVPGVTSTPPMRYTLLEITADNKDAQEAFVEGCQWVYAHQPVRLDEPGVGIEVGAYWRKDVEGHIDIVSAAWVATAKVDAKIAAAATSAEIHAWVVKNLADLTPSLAGRDAILESAVRLHVYADRLGFDLTAALTDHVRGGAEREARKAAEERAPKAGLPPGWYRVGPQSTTS